jgi:hypothetical protein
VHLARGSQGAVTVARVLHEVKGRDERVAELVRLVRRACRFDAARHVVGEKPVQQLLVLCAAPQDVSVGLEKGKHLFDELELGGKLQNGGVGDLVFEVGIFIGVPRESEGEAHGVGRVLMNGLAQSQKVAS